MRSGRTFKSSPSRWARNSRMADLAKSWRSGHTMTSHDRYSPAAWRRHEADQAARPNGACGNFGVDDRNWPDSALGALGRGSPSPEATAHPQGTLAHFCGGHSRTGMPVAGKLTTEVRRSCRPSMSTLAAKRLLPEDRPSVSFYQYCCGGPGFVIPETFDFPYADIFAHQRFRRPIGSDGADGEGIAF